jgi:zinc finger FYVE domain-containing protein 1
VKVISIFGNAGEGKSHTLNHLFFEGKEVFPESAQPDPCTLGIRAAFSSDEQLLCLDTEGLLGATSQENQRTRLLLKVKNSNFASAVNILKFIYPDFSRVRCRTF